ncbi:MAG: SpoIVB peptidase [Clostridia bacterium]|nr:SpoIVB peptidase [Clostridia bacterium]
MRNVLKVSILIVLFIFYVYILAIESIPNSLILFDGENVNIKTILGLNINQEGEENNINISLLGKVPVKEVSVSVLPRTTVIPVGTVAGVKLYTNGVLVVGMTEVQGIDNIKYKPYENSGIKEGDMIISIEEKEISNTVDLVKTVNESKGEEVEIKYVRDGQTLECSMIPTQTSKTEYKLGLWVRDSAAGVGTVSFYEPKTKIFGALGHGITDIDTGKLINIANGEFITTKVLSISKGEEGVPGKMQGTINNQHNIGKIYKNTNFGIYGIVDDLSSLNIDSSREMEVALREEINLGKAKILTSLDNEKVTEYEIEIEKIFTNNNYDNKSMLIKVTDESLINKTGGIIQGMSGSPIIQNGKFIGAVTNVLVNDPKQGYAIFGDLMIKQAKEVE